MKIPFNKPYLTGKEAHYLYQAVLSGKISGNGMFTQKCHRFFEERYGFKKTLLTTSCTDALEMAAILVAITPEYFLFAALDPGALMGRARFALRVASLSLIRELG